MINSKLIRYHNTQTLSTALFNLTKFRGRWTSKHCQDNVIGFELFKLLEETCELNRFLHTHSILQEQLIQLFGIYPGLKIQFPNLLNLR